MSDSKDFDIENKEDEIYVEDDDSFDVTFEQGFVFKSLIEFLRQTTQKGNFNFLKSRITYSKMDINKKIFNILDIECGLIPYNLQSYNDEIVYGINFKDLIAVIGKVKRKEGIKLFKKVNDSKLYVSILSSKKNSGTDNINEVKPYSEQDLQWKFEDDRDDDTDNDNSIVVSSSEFVDACNRITSIKCSDVSVVWVGKGIILETTVGTVIKREILGDVEDIHQASDIRINANSNTIKALSKLGNLCENGSVRLSLRKNRPFRIMTRIANYGLLKTFIFNDELLKDIRNISN